MRIWRGGIGVALLGVLASDSWAQQSAVARRFTLEVTGGAGYSLVDRTTWAGSEPVEYDQAGSNVDARLLYSLSPRLHVGVEAGYRTFWWYEVRYVPNNLYYSVEASRIGAVARVPINRFLAADLGGAAYGFDGGTSLGLSSALVVSIPIGARWSLPISLRGDSVFDETVLTYAGISAGLGVRF